MEEYKPSKVVKTSVCSACFGLAVTGIWYLSSSLKMIDDLSISGIIVTLMVLVVISIAVVGLLEVNTRKVIIERNRISMISILRYNEILQSEIKGYRVRSYNLLKFFKIKTVTIEPKDKSKKKIAIYSFFENCDKIIEQVASKYQDLDVKINRKTRKRKLSHEEFIKSKEVGNEIVAEGSKLVVGFYSFTALVSLWVYIYPKPYDLIVWVCMFYPVISLISFKTYCRLSQRDNMDGLYYGIIFIAILFSGVGISTVQNINLLEYYKISIAVLLLVIVLTVVVFFDLIDFQVKLNQIVQLLKEFAIFGFLLIPYSLSLIMLLNCHFDNSEPIKYKAEIVSMHYTTGKFSKSYLTLKPWGKIKENNSVSVKRNLYIQKHIGNTVTVNCYEGNLGIKWYVLTE